jgi:hypothetical protein
MALRTLKYFILKMKWSGIQQINVEVRDRNGGAPGSEFAPRDEQPWQSRRGTTCDVVWDIYA